MLTRSKTVLVNNLFQEKLPNKKVVSKTPVNPFTIMRTRSQTSNDTYYPLTPSRSSSRLTKLTVDIDFDEASSEWRKNKRSIGNGCYSYKNA